uniref:Uncharacterized protein n=1 Tax=Caenorhabditis tropicalis TaxID=1561998 RepID=A0A1I7V210_9PELO
MSSSSSSSTTHTGPCVESHFAHRPQHVSSQPSPEPVIIDLTTEDAVTETTVSRVLTCSTDAMETTAMETNGLETDMLGSDRMERNETETTGMETNLLETNGIMTNESLGDSSPLEAENSEEIPPETEEATRMMTTERNIMNDVLANQCNVMDSNEIVTDGIVANGLASNRIVTNEPDSLPPTAPLEYENSEEIPLETPGNVVFHSGSQSARIGSDHCPNANKL